MVARGLNVTVLCGLEGLGLEGVGGGKSRDVSVEAEAIAGMKTMFLTRFMCTLSWISQPFGFLTGVDGRVVVS